MSQHLPVILIELVLVLGGVFGFAWWQLRSVRKDRLEAAARRQREAATAAKSDTGEPLDDERRP